jgi:hypothetical protein
MRRSQYWLNSSAAWLFCSGYSLTSFGHKSSHPILRKVLNLLTRVPPLNQLFTSRIDCVFQKPGKHPYRRYPSGLRPGGSEGDTG